MGDYHNPPPPSSPASCPEISDPSTSRLFQPLQLGTITLNHRLVMAPTTRFRADTNHVPLPFVATYYEQRASVPGTLLITEATIISKRAGAYPCLPGFFTAEQVSAWRQSTDVVHAKGSFIFAQLWAPGRAADPGACKAAGVRILSSSAVPIAEGMAVPEEMSGEDIREFVGDYVKAARRAVGEAGFDGVELHGANGYLIDQFVQDTVNQRSDEYGGSVENRSRFALEVTKAVVDAVGADRVAIRLSPWSRGQGMRMADPVPQFTHLIRQLAGLKLAYLHLIEARICIDNDVDGQVAADEKLDFAVEAWDNVSPVILAGGYTPKSASEAADVRWRDRDVAVAFGRHFISTPDLPFRLRSSIPLNPYDRATFYKFGSPDGYTDYQFSKEWLDTARVHNHVS
ncbi:hypothetical protein GE09DRAFT_990726 [Coniochaeta sp. 2T2.1]|nr:hypothetical protein GE09DRAFT_990726 [Coniochaeta sp. 2T2.1]